MSQQQKMNSQGHPLPQQQIQQPSNVNFPHHKSQSFNQFSPNSNTNVSTVDSQSLPQRRSLSYSSLPQSSNQVIMQPSLQQKSQQANQQIQPAHIPRSNSQNQIQTQSSLQSQLLQKQQLQKEQQQKIQQQHQQQQQQQQLSQKPSQQILQNQLQISQVQQQNFQSPVSNPSQQQNVLTTQQWARFGGSPNQIPTSPTLAGISPRTKPYLSSPPAIVSSPTTSLQSPLSSSRPTQPLSRGVVVNPPSNQQSIQHSKFSNQSQSQSQILQASSPQQFPSVQTPTQGLQQNQQRTFQQSQSQSQTQSKSTPPSGFLYSQQQILLQQPQTQTQQSQNLTPQQQNLQSAPQISRLGGLQKSPLTLNLPLTSPLKQVKPGATLTETSKSVLGKRTLQNLLQQIDANEKMDADVEEVILELADDFIDTVTSFACSLASHRKSPVLEAKDVLLHLERNWNITIPGFGNEEFKSYKRPNVIEAHKQRLALVRKTAAMGLPHPNSNLNSTGLLTAGKHPNQSQAND